MLGPPRGQDLRVAPSWATREQGSLLTRSCLLELPV